MKIAYLITAYRDFDHLTRLIDNIQGEDTEIFVHIDRKCSYVLPDTLRRRTHLLEDRFLVNWGGFSLTLAFVSLMDACRQQGYYDFILLISGQDFPVASNEEIQRFLSLHRGCEFVAHHQLPFDGWSHSNGGLDRFQYEWPIDEMGFAAAREVVAEQQRRGVCRKFPSQLSPYGGSCWLTISYGLMAYVCDYIAANFDWIYPFFRKVLLADEILLHSIIMNSPYRHQVVNNDLRYIDWYSGPDFPRTLTMEDADKIAQSGCLFARKFDNNVDAAVIDQLEQRRWSQVQNKI
ncbi:beta-1,6-N-acetylglucosaminyltransferase [Chitinophaga sp.]|uniref:beta-1,6-N-acetylglucosaminyltransferase n=1 Tax=Chitinophaga sp. TaxID=1869181 RepID=UPI0031D82384